jgi:hypothetical protein
MIHPDDMPDRIPHNDEPPHDEVVEEFDNVKAYKEYDKKFTSAQCESKAIKEKYDWLRLSVDEITTACLQDVAPEYKSLMGYIKDPEDESRTVMIVRSFHTKNVYERSVDMPYMFFKSRMLEVKYGKYDGVFIQDVWPELTRSEREYMMTGLSDEEWNLLFPDEDGEKQKRYHYAKNGMKLDEDEV